MSGTHTPQLNHLLEALSDVERARILPQLQLVPMPLGKVLYESGDVLRHVYFPIDCIISLVRLTEDGGSAEISMVGNEGIVGIALFLGGETTRSRAIVQSAGWAYRLIGQRLKDEFHRSSEMHYLLLRYTQALITQVAQTAVCNRHHSLEQQLCRWLLLSLDRRPDNQLAMTHEFIADMLGVRREGVTEAAGKLQKAGAIQYSRGHITVLDRPKLEAMCCECYAVVKRESDRLLAQPRPPSSIKTQLHVPLNAFAETAASLPWREPDAAMVQQTGRGSMRIYAGERSLSRLGMNAANSFGDRALPFP